MTRPDDATTDRARIDAILAGAPTSPAEIRSLIAGCKRALDFDTARKLASKGIAADPGTLWLKQQLALCTYKDEELPPDDRMDEAIRILEGIGLRDPGNRDAETLALGGAVYKRMWEYDGQIEHLWEALAFYRAAHLRNPHDDKGYGGSNAAYILDLLAARARTAAHRAGTEAIESTKLYAEATALREVIAAQLEAREREEPALRDDYFFLVTRAEILFGMARHGEAGDVLAQAEALHPGEWERQTTFRQLVALARLQGLALPAEGTDPATWHAGWRALTRLLGAGTARALSCYRGKVGLALSGGGFRASFYHLGVMARLAEMDVLRGVDVLSTVSGGSIVGAHYYLEVQQLLQSTPDECITREDYVEIVGRVQREFLAGVERNLRMRALADWRASLRMVGRRDYTRSNRMGELYESELYARVQMRAQGKDPSDAASIPRGRTMTDLFIHPATDAVGGRDETFKPKFSNWRRGAKVPVLLINTTSLNSGHLWHFTASWMGEPPGLLGDEVDINRRYRRLYYCEAPTEALKAYPLGAAVAASACVPGLFEPLAIEGLFPDRTVRLVDGGVHDNLGVAGLLDEGCTFVLCSDASGQMRDVAVPPGGLLSPLMRSSQAIFMDRIRESEYQDLRKRVGSRSLTGLFFVHLQKDLTAPPLGWLGCTDGPPAATRSARATTPYGFDPELQKLIAGIRTDLDSFTEVEAYALMLSGYRMTQQQFALLDRQHREAGEAGRWGGFDVDARSREWPFLALEPIVALPADSPDPRRAELQTQLKASASLFFKVWHLSSRQELMTWGALGVLTVAILWLLAHGALHPLFALGRGVALLALLATTFIGAWNWFLPERPLHNHAGKAISALLGFCVAHFHLSFFDRKYLERGRLQRLMRRP